MVQVRQSTVIDAPVDAVWRVLRDFNGHDRWHPAIATSAIEGGEPVDMVGAVRRFRLADGGELREQLAGAVRREAHADLLPARSAAAADGLCRDDPAEAGDRRRRAPSGNGAPSSARRSIGARSWSGWCATASTRPASRRSASLLRTPKGRPPTPVAGRGTRRRWLAPSRCTRERARRRGVRVRADVVAGRMAPTRPRAIVVERYGGPEVLQLKESRCRRPAPGEVRIRHTRDRRQLHRRLLPHRLFRPADAAGRAGHGGGRHRRGSRVRASRLSTGRPRRLCLPAGRRLCRAAHHVARAAGAAAGRYLRRDRRGRLAQGRHGQLPAARRPSGAAGEVVAGPRRRRRRRPVAGAMGARISARL